MSLEWRYTPHVVAFIDVLGYKALTALNDTECKRVVELISRYFGARRSGPDFDNKLVPGGWRASARFFSDCICMSDEVSDIGFYGVIVQAAHLAHKLAVEGIYLRGGIATGRHYQDVNIIFGEGIVRAYSLEHERAKHPRIVLEPTIVASIPDNAKPLITKGQDGEHFVDFWRYWEWDHTRTGSCQAG